MANSTEEQYIAEARTWNLSKLSIARLKKNSTYAGSLTMKHLRAFSFMEIDSLWRCLAQKQTYEHSIIRNPKIPIFFCESPRSFVRRQFTFPFLLPSGRARQIDGGAPIDFFICISTNSRTTSSSTSSSAAPASSLAGSSRWHNNTQQEQQ